MTTIFTHPAVEKYLAELNDALRERPDGHADDLRDQVREHIEEALSPDATDADVEATLAGLGAPAQLAGDDSGAQPGVVYTRPSVTGWLKQRPRNFWAAVIVVVVLLIAATVAVTVETNIAAIQGDCYPCAFLFPEDRLHVTEPPSYSNEDSMIVAERFGQDQAVTFSLSNPSRYAQVVKGGVMGGPYFTLEPMSLDISTVGPGHENPIDDWPQKFARSDVVIPAHGIRQVVLHLVQNSCIEPGGGGSFDQIQLQVRTLAITRSETVKIGLAFTIVGSRARGHCRNGQTGHGTFRRSI